MVWHRWPALTPRSRSARKIFRKWGQAAIRGRSSIPGKRGRGWGRGAREGIRREGSPRSLGERASKTSWKEVFEAFARAGLRASTVSDLIVGTLNPHRRKEPPKRSCALDAPRSPLTTLAGRTFPADAFTLPTSACRSRWPGTAVLWNRIQNPPWSRSRFRVQVQAPRPG